MAQVATEVQIELKTLLKAYRLMCCVKEMARLYDEHRDKAHIVHSTSRGHEAIQLAVGMQLLPQDYVYPYYRDESILLGIGMTPYELMLQLMAKRDDPFSMGRMYYGHPSLRDPDKPKIPYQSSAVGMQAIPATGAAHGIKYKEQVGLADYKDQLPPIVVCSLGDGAITEGEVSEAFQEAVLRQLPIIYLIQDNDWSISAHKEEIAAMKAPQYAKGFPGMEVVEVDGTDFIDCYLTFAKVAETVRKERRPFLLYAPVALLHHHTSGVRKEWYRDPEELKTLEETKDPRKILRKHLLEIGVKEKALEQLEQEVKEQIEKDFFRAWQAKDPEPEDLYKYVYAPTPITEERGEREPKDRKKKIVMVDAALYACEEILRKHPEALLYGQDVGRRLGGVFREAATLAEKFGDERVFNTPVQEAYIIGSTSGMSAVGCKPIVEIQFADYIWPGLNQLFTELSRSYYLSAGKWPVYAVIRVPIGAYGGGGPFHSSSCESVLCNIKGIKVVYPSNAADMKGLLKAAFYDPNPVVILEHKGLYWSKVKGTEAAMTIEPDEDYVIPIGKARIALHASEEALEMGDTCLVITYGMGVHWALNAAKAFENQVEIIDLRSLQPYDWELITERVKQHGKVLVVTEEPGTNSFAQALSGRIASELFEYLDAPVQLVAAPDVPGIPTSLILENEYLPGIEKTQAAIEKLLQW